ncbi:hypothetical protein GCK32_004989 [Trichostrongylus colubriformis]|uniref:SAM domain-containing protein n=1 Tax=Trichostrongylus colubriformis TaxID=6319 RepID=A0AAN8GFA5_TRICO
MVVNAVLFQVAGIYGCDDQPALRRFTRYNHGMMEAPVVSAPPPPSSFSKTTKKPSFFSGNWTFRDRKQSRPTMDHDCMRRDDRPMSMNLSESRSSRSKSEAAAQRQVEIRVPVKIERPPSSDAYRRTRQLSETAAVYKTNITVDDSAVTTQQAILRQKKELAETNNNNYNYNSRPAPQRALPAVIKGVADKVDKEWALDDVLLWLQACGLDDVASLLIGYDLRGTDLLSWDHDCLSQLGVTSAPIREKILKELTAIRERGPEEAKDLLEINDCPGEQFKSALMLTKLISDSNGSPIRFVVLRMKTIERADDSFNETSSSGVSSSPRSPSE